MIGIIINGRPATKEEQEMLATSFIKSIFDSMTEQEIKDMVNEIFEDTVFKIALEKKIRKDDKND